LDVPDLGGAGGAPVPVRFWGTVAVL